VDWVGHFAAVAAYDSATSLAESLGVDAGAGADKATDYPFLTRKQNYTLRRQLEAYRFGSGRDYKAD